MNDLTRRSVLSLGAALGLVSVGVGAADPAEAWSSKGSIAATDTVTDPFWVWDDATDPLVASLLDGGQIPAVNTAFRSWVANGDPLPAGPPAGVAAYWPRS